MSTLALHRAKSIYGWMSDAELEFLAHVAFDSKVIFEIGCFQGRSTRVLGDNVRDYVVAIDPWGTDNYDAYEHGVLYETNQDTFNMFYCNLHDLIKRNKVVPVRKKWADHYPDTKADFIFIDGDHRYDSVIADIRKASCWIKSGGIIAGHDYAMGWPGVVKAVNDSFPAEKINVAGTIWWVKI